MTVIHDITIDVLKPRQTVIHVVQGDSTRKIRLTLLANNVPFDPADDLDVGDELLAFVEYKRPDGTSGLYDTTSIGETAVHLQDDLGNNTNIYIVALDGVCFTVPGWTQINIRFETEAGKRIHTLRIMADVERSACPDNDPSEQPGINSIGDLKAAVAAMWDKMFPPNAKQSLLKYLKNIAYFKNDHASEYYDELEAALFQTAEIVSISAVFDQGTAVIYDTYDLDTLRQYLTVTATYEDMSAREITGYALSGTLTEGTSTITVSYGGKTTTFDVVVAHGVDGWYYPFNSSIASIGTHDFGLTGVQTYAAGVNSGEQCYYHHVAIEGDANTDPLGLYALASTDYPVWSNSDFTIAFWWKSDTAGRGWQFAASKRSASDASKDWTGLTISTVASGWNVSSSAGNPAYAGIRLGTVSEKLYLSIYHATYGKGKQINITAPNSFDNTQWHHYALTRSGAVLYYFIDGSLIFTVTMTAGDELYSSNVITIGNIISQTNTTPTVTAYPFSSYHQDLYVNVGTAKWTSDFDPTDIEY